MLQIHCTGTPYEIGLKHGTSARPQIASTIDFYTSLFQQTANLSWSDVRALASETFEPTISQKWPDFYAEMRGIADGSARDLSEIVALNVRTEIAFGLATRNGGGGEPSGDGGPAVMLGDACTALAWTLPPSPSTTPGSPDGEGRTFLAQNWDWQLAQKPNLVDLRIDLPSPTPNPSFPPLRIRTVTEAGLLAKIGLNSRGLGVCLNAISARGLSPEKLPCHLALRLVLQQTSVDAAVKALKGEGGVASACHFLLADGTGGARGLEWSSTGLRELEVGQGERLAHSNHYLKDPGSGVRHDPDWLKDSRERVGRAEEICREIEERRKREGGEVGMEDVQSLFKDEEGWPGAICRAADGRKEGDTVETLFNIVMDLSVPRAEVVVGRPVKGEERFEIRF